MTITNKQRSLTKKYEKKCLNLSELALWNDWYWILPGKVYIRHLMTTFHFLMSRIIWFQKVFMIFLKTFIRLKWFRLSTRAFSSLSKFTSLCMYVSNTAHTVQLFLENFSADCMLDGRLPHDFKWNNNWQSCKQPNEFVLTCLYLCMAKARANFNRYIRVNHL